MIDTRLILIDGIPGSGKSTIGKWISEKLDYLQIPNHFFHELQQNHPLWIYDHKFSSFSIDSEAQLFMEKTKSLLNNFVEERADKGEIAIVESWMFQGTIDFSLLQHIDYFILFEFIDELQKILRKLNPIMVYFYQADVERNWRWICNLRGKEFTEGRCGIHDEEDYKQAGILWSSIQEFNYGVLKNWDIPKLILRNENYTWNEYQNQIIRFLETSICSIHAQGKRL